jgi:hypothetical protein
MVDGLRVYISGVIVASMRFSNNGYRHPRVLKPHREGNLFFRRPDDVFAIAYSRLATSMLK